jgi:hypothetical protein
LFFPCSSLRFPRLVFRSASNAPDGSCFCSFDFFGRVWRALLVPISVSPALGFGLVTGFGGEEHPTRSFVLLPSGRLGSLLLGQGIRFFCVCQVL